MNIVFMVHTFPVNGLSTSGAGSYVANMASIMSDSGHKVFVITEADKRNNFSWNNIEIRQVRVANGFINRGDKLSTYKKVIKNIRRSVLYNFEVYKISKEIKIDVVQSVNTLGLSLLRLKNIPYIVRVSDFPPLWSGTRTEEYDYDKLLKRKRFDEELMFLSVKRADKVVVPSYLMQELYWGKIHKEAVVIESPINTENYGNLVFNEDKFEIDNYIVTYGAMNCRKEIHLLTKIIDKVLERYPNLKYVMIGKNIEISIDNSSMKVSDYFKKHITRNYDRFVYLGEISDRQRLLSIVKSANICVLPTRIDNLPNTVLESMALGKVIVSSTCEHGTSVEQLITDGENGFLAQVDDSEDLYGKIIQAIELSETDKILMGSKAKDRVKDLTPKKVYEKMMEVYSEVIERKKYEIRR